MCRSRNKSFGNAGRIGVGGKWLRKEKVFVVLTHHRVPSASKPGAWDIKERADFVDQIRKRHQSAATTIVDYINEEVVKDRNKRNYKDLLWHLTKTYPQQMKELRAEYKDEKGNTV